MSVDPDFIASVAGGLALALVWLLTTSPSVRRRQRAAILRSLR